MNKKLHVFKIFTIFLIIFCSSFSFIILCPTGKAGPLDPIYECNTHIEIEYNKSISEQPVIPYSEPIELPVTIRAKITGPTADIVEEYLAGSFLIVHLSLEDVPQGCYASINPPFVRYTGISTDYKTANATISFTIDQYVPAFSYKNFTLNMTVDSLRGKGLVIIPGGVLVKSASYSFPISFMVGYQPQLSFSYPEKNVKSIGPDETATFPIEIENWGNSPSTIKIEVEDVPDGWQANIVDTLTLVTNLFGAEAKGNVILNVKPPIDFGYHEERAIITVKMTPTTTGPENLYLEGEPHYLHFVVQSKGISTALPPGSEMIILVFAFILILFLIWNSKKAKNYKQFRGRKK
jgi:hypothetical protein